MILNLNLPENSSILTKKGKIAFGDNLYTVGEDETINISISEKLGIKPEHIFQHLRVVIGDTIKEGTVLAEKKRLLGKAYTYSEHDGTVVRINHDTGTMSLTVQGKKKKIMPSFFTGVIQDYDSLSHKLTIEIEKGKIIELKEVSQNGGGKILPFNVDTDYFSLTEEQVSGSIIVIDEPQPHFEPKLEALSVNGYAFLKGTAKTDLPSIKIKTIDDYKLLLSGKYSHIVFSSLEKKAIIYLI